MEKSQMRVRPGFLLGLLVVFVIIPWLVSLFLPAIGGPTGARIAMTRRDIAGMNSALVQQIGVGRVETSIHIESSNRFSAAFFSFTTDAIHVDPRRTNVNGELQDRWSTPYRIEIVVQTNYVIRSAGKNRKFGDRDDIIFDSVKHGFVKP